MSCRRQHTHVLGTAGRGQPPGHCRRHPWLLPLLHGACCVARRPMRCGRLHAAGSQHSAGLVQQSGTASASASAATAAGQVGLMLRAYSWSQRSIGSCCICCCVQPSALVHTTRLYMQGLLKARCTLKPRLVWPNHGATLQPFIPLRPPLERVAVDTANARAASRCWWQQYRQYSPTKLAAVNSASE